MKIGLVTGSDLDCFFLVLDRNEGMSAGLVINPLHFKEGRAAIEVPTSTVTAMAGNSVMTGGMVTSTPRSGSPVDYFCVP